MRAAADQQISLTDPDSRSMATSGRGSGVVGYNVQVAVDTEHHLIVTHEVTNVGSDHSQLANIAKPVARNVWLSIGAVMPAAAARRRIISHAAYWFIGRSVRTSALCRGAVRKSQPLRSPAMPAASI